MRVMHCDCCNTSEDVMGDVEVVCSTECGADMKEVDLCAECHEKILSENRNGFIPAYQNGVNIRFQLSSAVFLVCGLCIHAHKAGDKHVCRFSMMEGIDVTRNISDNTLYEMCPLRDISR